jgi:hypothetical protein
MSLLIMNMVPFGLRGRYRHSDGVNKIFQFSVILSIVTSQSFIDKKMNESISFDIDKAADAITEELIPEKLNSVSNVRKINHGLPLCLNNVNGVYLQEVAELIIIFRKSSLKEKTSDLFFLKYNLIIINYKFYVRFRDSAPKPFHR